MIVMWVKSKAEFTPVLPQERTLDSAPEQSLSQAEGGEEKPQLLRLKVGVHRDPLRWC